MDLVERYIEAVKFWLPKHLKEDIAAELREDIRSEIDEAEHEKGRPLTEDEVAAILKERGAPMTVASRYLPQRSLIGPELYPLYIFVLKIVAGICVAVPLVFWVFNSLVHGEIPRSVPMPFGDLLSAFAIVTIIFAIIEHEGVKPGKKTSWNPKSLPVVTDKNRIKRGESVGEIIGSLVVIGFFAAGYLSQTTYEPLNASITVSPEWIPYWQFIAVVMIAEIGLSAVNLFKPYWSGSRILLRLVIDLVKLGAIVWLLQSHLLRAISAPGMQPDSAAKILEISDKAAQYADLFGIVIAIAIVIAAVTRVVHLVRRPSPALA